MKEVSHQSLHEIRDIIPGQNYANVKARLDQLLPEEYSSIFSKVNFFSDKASWFGEDHIQYHPYNEASDDEKEDIAILLDNARSHSVAQLAQNMPYIEKVFVVPSSDDILWYRDSNNNMRVLLTKWGFRKRQGVKDADIIDMLINLPRKKIQEDIDVKIIYSDGGLATKIPFRLQIFNHTKEATTRHDGTYHIGKIYEGQTFAVEDSEGCQHQDFTVKHGAEYVAKFNLFTTACVTVVNQTGELRPGFRLLVNGAEAITDEDGLCIIENILLSGNDELSVALEHGGCLRQYSLSRNDEQNKFSYEVEEDSQPEPEPEPEPAPEPAPEPVPTPLPPPIPKMVCIKLLDFDGAPLCNIPFSIEGKGKKSITGMSDHRGIGVIPASLLEGGGKYKVRFAITPGMREKINSSKKPE